MFDVAREQAKADAIPRYALPTWDELREPEPKEGECRNCDHRTQIILGGKTYQLCAQERDDGNIDGEVYECDPEVSDCPDWDWDGYEL